MPLRHQLAVYSPVSLRAGGRAAGDALRPGADPRAALLASLLGDYAADSGALCGSGTQALQLALLEARRRGGDAPVALPAFTCYDIASAAVGAGVRVALYDVDPDTLAPDPASLERVLAAGAGVVVAGPLYGVPLEWDALREMAGRHGALLVEDAAQGHGAAWRGRPLGSLGELSVLSFGRGKGWTGGRGGALLARDGAAADPAALPVPTPADEARTAVLVAAQWLLGRPEVYGIPASIPGLGLGETVYHDPSAPAGITRAAAALLRHAQGASRREGAARRANAAALLERLPAGARPVRVPAAGEAGWLRLPVRLSGGMQGIARSDRARRLGVAGSYPTTLAEVPQLGALLAGPETRWPGAETLVRELVTLPTHSRVTAAERAEILELLRP
jgi:dTDP-4-amino-4,6-dideoxygalactose transaminase